MALRNGCNIKAVFDDDDANLMPFRQLGVKTFHVDQKEVKKLPISTFSFLIDEFLESQKEIEE